MKEYQNILFVSQGLSDEHRALEQSIKLAHSNQADLRGLILCPTLPSNMQKYEHLYEQSLEDHLARQIQYLLAEEQINDELPFNIEIGSGDKPVVKAIETVLTHQHDLLIKDIELNDTDSRGFRALDMQLLRKCPCAVWLHRPSVKTELKQRIAIAIDPVASTKEEQALALQLLHTGNALAREHDNHLHIISCWQYELEHYLRHHSWIQVDDEELNAEVALARHNHLNLLNELIDKSNLECEIAIHHINGPADEEIPRSVNELGIDILVMGTVARGGVKGLVMGNTAENICQSLTCSLVALKPASFRTPIS